MSGTGTVTQAGHGTLTLIGDKAYTGGTFAKSGTVVLNGSLSSPVAVAAGATFAGQGTIFGSATIDGTIAPGLSDAPFGSLRVTGDLELIAWRAPRGDRRLWRETIPSLSRAERRRSAARLSRLIPEKGSYGRVTFYPVLFCRRRTYAERLPQRRRTPRSSPGSPRLPMPSL